jgi:drug/metabolite transporter (DMT)-like permease
MATPAPKRPRPGTRHLVRPRWVWLGLLVALLGACLLGLGVAVLDGPTAIIGAVVLLVGAAAGLRGGVLYDARPALDLRAELRDVLDANVHPGVAPGDSVRDPAVVREAARADATRQFLEESSRHPPGTRWAPVAGWALLLLAAVLVVMQGALAAHTTTGRSTSVRDAGLAVLLGLAGLVLATTRGHHPVAMAIVALAGLGLLGSGLLADHDHTATAVVEVVGGWLAVLLALTAWRSPALSARP